MLADEGLLVSCVIAARWVDRGPKRQLRRCVRWPIAVGNRVDERGAVELIEITEILVRSAEPNVIRKVPVGRRAAGFDSRVVIKRRRAKCQVARCVSRIGSGLDDLVNEAGQAGRVGIRLAASRINLKLLLSERRFGVAGIVVERTVDRYAVVFVADLIVVSAPNVDRLIHADLVGRNVRSGHCRDRRVRVVQPAAAPERGSRRREPGIDGVDVGTGARPNRIEGGTRDDVRDLREAFL